MPEAQSIGFRKMNGLGNDFVVLDARARPLVLTEPAARAIADRKTGIGCDQVIVLEKSPVADVKMRIWNNEGFEVESCGNASRCIADLIFEEAGKKVATIDTLGGFLEARKSGEKLVTMTTASRALAGRRYRCRSLLPIRAISNCRWGRSMHRLSIRLRW